MLDIKLNDYQLQRISRYIKVAGIATVVTVLMVEPAFANLDAGIKTVTAGAEKLKNAILSIAGIAAVIYLLWKAIQAWQGRCEWGEFAFSVGYVALAGGAAVIANWAWGLFSGNAIGT